MPRARRAVPRRDVTTIEGLAGDETLHPLPAAFITHDGFQCGYCTASQICSAIGMLTEFQAGVLSAVTADVSASTIEWTEQELKERMDNKLPFFFTLSERDADVWRLALSQSATN